LEIEEVSYISYVEAVLIHFDVMEFFAETHFGVAEPSLIKSALARPQHAVVYEQADIIRQASTLCFGLIKNHPWVGGNKRTATAIMEEFLSRNGWEVTASVEEIIAMVLEVESDRWKVAEIESWLRQRVIRTR
jgi:death-on-curing protein